MNPTELRDEFPVLRTLAYLNAGTDGPLSARAVRAAADELTREAGDGRARPHFERRSELNERLRESYAVALGCATVDVALTSCTSEGIAAVIGGLDLRPGDEILTSDEEHPGLLGALAAARELRGVTVRAVPLAEIAQQVKHGSARNRPLSGGSSSGGGGSSSGVGEAGATRLVACSHVGWMSGRLAPAELAQLDVPVLLDGAQGIGAIPVNVQALGCDAYAGAGQKWLCGPDGTGMLYVSESLRARLGVQRRGYTNLADPETGLDARVHEDARSFDAMSLSAEAVACALAAIGVLEEAGWQEVHTRALGLADHLAELLAEHGRAVAPRGASTLVSFASPDPEHERERLAEQGVIVRNIPGAPWLRASVGAWNDEHDLQRMLAALHE